MDLHRSLDPQVAKILEGKNLLLLEKIAESFNWPDTNLFKEIAEGFSLVGTPDQSGVFPSEVNVPTMSVEQLDGESRVLKAMLWDKVAKGQFDKDTWDATMEEAGDKSWLDGPYSWDELENMFGGACHGHQSGDLALCNQGNCVL